LSQGFIWDLFDLLFEALKVARVMFCWLNTWIHSEYLTTKWFGAFTYVHQLIVCVLAPLNLFDVNSFKEGLLSFLVLGFSKQIISFFAAHLWVDCANRCNSCFELGKESCKVGSSLL